MLRRLAAALLVPLLGAAVPGALLPAPEPGTPAPATPAGGAAAAAPGAPDGGSDAHAPAGGGGHVAPSPPPGHERAPLEEPTAPALDAARAMVIAWRQLARLATALPRLLYHGTQAPAHRLHGERLSERRDAVPPLGLLSWDDVEVGLSDLGAYINVHKGFTLALVLAVFLPLVALCCCCIGRACRRRGARQALAEKRREGSDALDDAAGGERGAEADAGEPAAAESEAPASRSPPVHPDAARGLPPAAAVEAFLLPVDAYHGVRPDAFHL